MIQRFVKILTSLAKQKKKMNKENNLKHIEYYVVYYKDNRRCFSKNFLNKCEAEDYAQSMSKNGFIRIEVCTYTY